MPKTGLQQRSDERALPLGSKAADATDANPLGLAAPPAPSSPKPTRWFALGAVFVLALGMLAIFAVLALARDKKESILNAEQKRVQEAVLGRISILETWLDAQSSASRRLTDSHVFRLFVADLALHDRTLPLPPSIRDQQPYFRQLITDFAKRNGLARAAILREDGTILLSSPGPALAVPDLLRQRPETVAKGRLRLSEIRRLGERDGQLVVDAITDVPPAQAEAGASPAPRVLLAMTLPIDQTLRKILASTATDPSHETLSLLQWRGDDIERFRVAGDVLELSTLPLPEGLPAGENIPFKPRLEDVAVYSLGKPTGMGSWTLYQALDAEAVLSPVSDFIRLAAFMSLLAVVAVTAAAVALWRHRDYEHHRNLVDFYQAHAIMAERQRQFLQSVTTSMGDWLTVTSPRGELIYMNAAFEAAAGQSRSTLAGRAWEDLVDDAQAGKPPDDWLGLIDAGPFDVVEIAGRQRVISTHVSDLKAESGGIEGTIRVVRDHTDLVAERRRRLTSLTQTVDAFIHAIELRDPFLLGHTRRVRDLVIALGRRLGLSTHELANLALAASLSQIGKIFVPDEVLTKPERHDSQEEKIMRDHILHAVDILKRIDFQAPIVDVLVQMHERLDGSGYPFGIVRNQISKSARILAVADVFCARTAPRSYRDRLSSGKALYHLASNERRYDMTVVAALAEIVGREEMPGASDMIERSFIDAAIWQRRQESHDRIREQA